MTFKEAEEIAYLYEHYIDKSCTCFQGNAQCASCELMPSKDGYEQALQRIERGY